MDPSETLDLALVLFLFEAFLVFAEPEVIPVDETKIYFVGRKSFEEGRSYSLQSAADVVKDPDFIHNKTTLCIRDFYLPQLQNSHKVADAYIAYDQINFMYLDWGAPLVEDASEVQTPNVDELGPLIADFILQLFKHIEPEGFHLLSYSTGVELAANVAKCIIDKSNGTSKLDRLTALAPQKNLGNNTLKGLAHFVDVIHTDDLCNRSSTDLGDADFYPNGGGFQPGCQYKEDGCMCSKKRSWEYWTESLSGPESPKFCAYNIIVLVRAVPQYLGFPAFMGIDCSKNSRGRYHLNTNDKPPYALGCDTQIN